MEDELKDKLAKGWLHVYMLFEIIGKPKEHITDVLNTIIKKLGEEKNVNIVKSKSHEAKPAKDSEEMFSSFAEVEVVTVNMARVMEIIFDYMPSSVEILHPKNLKFNLSDANGLLNDLSMRLHKLNMLTRTLIAQREALKNKIKETQDKKS
ncbi:MAG: hypothetical protein JSW08_00955 [archaeon]|nr:MAG: hypothetical protein JSW08_00955 [archaeon]